LHGIRRAFEVGVNLGIRGRLFALSLAAIATAVTVLNLYVSSELRRAIEDRMVEDLEVRAGLIAKQIERRANKK